MVNTYKKGSLAGALLLFVMNLIGLGLGPLLTGMISDTIRSHLEAAGLAEATATADGLRYALPHGLRESLVGIPLLSKRAHDPRGRCRADLISRFR
jgi:hypothetical protein